MIIHPIIEVSDFNLFLLLLTKPNPVTDVWKWEFNNMIRFLKNLKPQSLAEVHVVKHPVLNLEERRKSKRCGELDPRRVSDMNKMLTFTQTLLLLSKQTGQDATAR
ncbi:hypothetical protein ATANTOWER_027974 [Ataeniobius toweri]|uniref:Uncharacterized protein n=1 Tax=Ataeniobius toweri TaxID=208326 RepID=A0ABU7B028_9TELE|nr:hypothetical protein [Ataeniobius toweri]